MAMGAGDRFLVLGEEFGKVLGMKIESPLETGAGLAAWVASTAVLLRHDKDALKNIGGIEKATDLGFESLGGPLVGFGFLG